jgi:hypothetical protein
MQEQIGTKPDMTGVIMILTGCHAAGYGAKADDIPFCTLVSRYPDRNL